MRRIKRLWHSVLDSRIIPFLIVGGISVGLHLLITYLLTTFLFGLEGYFYSYLIGLIVALLWNFVMHTLVTYKTKKGHAKRFPIFMTMTLTISFLQATTVKLLTPLLGLKWYLFVIAGTVFFYSMITFLVFKLWLFKER